MPDLVGLIIIYEPCLSNILFLSRFFLVINNSFWGRQFPFACLSVYFDDGSFRTFFLPTTEGKE